MKENMIEKGREEFVLVVDDGISGKEGVVEGHF